MPSVLRAGYSKTAPNVGYAFVPVTETFPEIKPNAAKKDLTGLKSLVDHSSFPTPDYEQWYII
jgi:hypothetical protein